MPFKSREILPYPGGDLVAWSWGEGPVVLLCHGWESRGGWLASSFVDPLLERGYRVVAFDMPGHGRSPGLHSEVMDFAHAIKTVADHVGGVRHIIAHSLGAATTSIAIANDELSVERLVYLAPVCWMLSLPERFMTALSVPPATESRLWELLYETHSRADWIAASGDVVSPRLTAPGLIFHDDRDGEVHFEGGELINSLWKGSSFVKTSGLGHRRIVRDPAVIAQAVEFLGDASPTS